jgi:hypothetical protein
MSRGRLIFPFLADIRRHNRAATAADPDGAGPLTSGFDDLYREPVVLPGSGATEAVGVSARVEHDPLLVPCQVEDNMWARLQAMMNGNSPRGILTLVFHFKDLERMSLVDDKGMALIQTGDRLQAIHDKRGNLVQEILSPPGMYVVDAVPAGHGLGSKRNLLITTFEPRDQGIVVG